MRFPLSLDISLINYLIEKRLQRQEKFPLVLMLEPTHLCNLACKGCGRIQEYRDTLGQMMPLEECLTSVEECGAPVVTITGGEPLLYPPVFELVQELIRRRKHIYLCTNGLLLEKSLANLPASNYLTLSVHLDGLAPTHDLILGRPGVFDQSIKAIKAAKRQGFQVCTNTTIYKQTDIQEIEILFAYLTYLDINGLLVSPAFSFESVDPELFLSREEIKEKFARLTASGNKFKFYDSPLYLEFLRGERDYECTPWANPTRNPRGWRSPCYQLMDAHYPTFEEFMTQTEWERYGVGRDPRCQQCMMHSGFEPTVVRTLGRDLKDLWEMLRWNLS
ncbi:MAG: adenosyl-hopene transferase HpnH [Deltaproteobacteria bacterium]|nr:adenosyl-hopene transferase HpnH [Deltaproteobacteria bacterium]MBW1951915.1 adenosyl-hopene transferase HpnH [Deltaproteobacteria bacterium]MBW1986337.1 adenosyl-hopene transferase HpnH [Deltaproteobacteria bacterium]MBW2134379.1 adenosyl-hopene transferase HpnH [Deltaproteobacteria bacterium]